MTSHDYPTARGVVHVTASADRVTVSLPRVRRDDRDGLELELLDVLDATRALDCVRIALGDAIAWGGAAMTCLHARADECMWVDWCRWPGDLTPDDGSTSPFPEFLPWLTSWPCTLCRGYVGFDVLGISRALGQHACACGTCEASR